MSPIHSSLHTKSKKIINNKKIVLPIDKEYYIILICFIIM